MSIHLTSPGITPSIRDARQSSASKKSAVNSSLKGNAVPSKTNKNSSKIKASVLKTNESPKVSLPELLKTIPNLPFYHEKMMGLKVDIQRFCTYTTQLIDKETAFVTSKLGESCLVQCEKEWLTAKLSCLNRAKSACIKINQIAQTCFQLEKCAKPKNFPFDSNKIYFISSETAHNFGYELRIINFYMLKTILLVNATITFPKEVLDGKKVILYKIKECDDLAKLVWELACFYAPFASSDAQAYPN